MTNIINGNKYPHMVWLSDFGKDVLGGVTVQSWALQRKKEIKLAHFAEAAHLDTSRPTRSFSAEGMPLFLAVVTKLYTECSEEELEHIAVSVEVDAVSGGLGFIIMNVCTPEQEAKGCDPVFLLGSDYRVVLAYGDKAQARVVDTANRPMNEIVRDLVEEITHHTAEPDSTDASDAEAGNS